jgi:hypothetical protein
MRHNSYQLGRPGSSDPTTPGSAQSPHRPSVPDSNRRPTHRKSIGLNQIRETTLAMNRGAKSDNEMALGIGPV